MKKIIFIVLLFLSSLLTAQDASKKKIDRYNDLINYIPKSLEKDTIYNPEIPISEIHFNNIINIKLHYGLKHFVKFSEKDIAWMEEKIIKLAKTLHAEGTYILIGQTINSEEEKLMYQIYLNTIKITHLNFSHGCTDGYVDDDFIKIFNDTMYSLMEIEPPNRKTNLFYGEYIGRTKSRLEMRLVLNTDRTFKFWIHKGHGADFTEGLWKNKNDTLILNSKVLNNTNSISYLLSSAKWIEFNNLTFRLKKEKLIALDNKKWKLKKVPK